ncbi:12.6 kDa Inhibitor of apoptosis/RING-finger profile [Spodoptera frugiperda ascovirus 1a]|uniref:12.6 kDa Inhibitor of apoptosis/RING-finger profile n=1 Tax=Spodoptera frugiperda ascovirus 1a TaxID=113370 RepID=Q0E585_SFAVA|nr:12.6 kDa Inhibitor of apoptosis/RING-finger profile [Spodoptera frugiperda ascovirus 1a]CAL44616.1 12.6 kDa Inhibitor of apoptosis/RING-finger profile [Spodoptera frugiperda ascovirus 1a]
MYLTMDLTCNEDHYYDSTDPESLERYIDTCGRLGTCDVMVDKIDNVIADLCTLRRTKYCTVCMCKKSSVVFVPCGHYICCDSCASMLCSNKCPLCRARIALRIYVNNNKR